MVLQAHSRPALCSVDLHAARVHEGCGTKRLHIVSGLQTVNALSSLPRVQQTSYNDILIGAANVVDLFCDCSATMNHVPVLVRSRLGRPLQFHIAMHAFLYHVHTVH